jgi:hypothetical protein
MRRVLLAAASAVAFWAMSAAVMSTASAAGHEQVVFSGEAEGADGEVEFWVWCAVDETGNYDDCRGALRFDDLQLTRHVDGEVAEVDDDVYRMDVFSTLDDAVQCTLQNAAPITHGPTNTVTVECASPSLRATTTDAVVTNNG